MPMIPLIKKELFSSLGDGRYMGTIFASFFFTLLMAGILLNSVSSFKEGQLLSSLPISPKMVKVAVVENGYHQSIGNLASSPTVFVVKATYEEAQRMLERGEIHGIYIIDEHSGKFIGANSPLAVLAEIAVKEAIDKVVRAGSPKAYEFQGDMGLEDLIRGLLAPITLLSPVFLWCLPIIQSIAYDRENKMLELLFAAPLDRKRILISKFLANFAFVAIIGAVWVAIVHVWGFNFADPLGVYLVLLSVTALLISLNALLSSISSNVQEATLASSLVSTGVFTILFLITMLKIFPFTSVFADISPATYIARNVTEHAAFPLYPVAMMLVMALSSLVLAVSAFSSEAFAFSVRPGIRQLYEGMLEILRDKMSASVAMGFVAFSLTTPVQLVVFSLTFFMTGLQVPLLIGSLVLVEEVLKAISLLVIKPSSVRNGIAYGAVVGLTFGLCESLLMGPFLGFLAASRIFPILVHTIATATVGAGSRWGRLGFAISLLLAFLFHFAYNFYLFYLWRSGALGAV